MFSDVTFAWERVFVFAQKENTLPPSNLLLQPPFRSVLPLSISLTLSLTYSLSYPHACAHCTRKLPVSLSLSHTYSIRHFGKKVLLAFFQSCSCSYYLVSLRRRVNTHTLPPSKLVRVLSLSLSFFAHSLSVFCTSTLFLYTLLPSLKFVLSHLVVLSQFAGFLFLGAFSLSQTATALSGT